ncbi:MAG: hypothetical protein HY908_18285 [Myxococcales bacterium]|nr:hypothetical protein [Myxococcales bacterium]
MPQSTRYRSAKPFGPSSYTRPSSRSAQPDETPAYQSCGSRRHSVASVQPEKPGHAARAAQNVPSVRFAANAFVASGQSRALATEVGAGVEADAMAVADGAPCGLPGAGGGG